MATKNVAANTSRAAAKAAKATPKAVVKSQLGAAEQVSIAIANIRKLNPRRYYRHSLPSTIRRPPLKRHDRRARPRRLTATR